MFCNEPEFCRINVDFKEFKLNKPSFYFMARAEPSAKVATAYNVSPSCHCHTDLKIVTVPGIYSRLITGLQTRT